MRLNQAKLAVDNEPDNQLYQMALIQTFEFTFELGWKVVKDYLKYNGVEARLPREAIKEGFAAGVIEDGQLWIDMMDARNSTSHSYDEKVAAQIVHNITNAYVVGFMQLAEFLQGKF
jgi:nucleotidyltransferase substrate binding protein (TIGR01987 family)